MWVVLLAGLPGRGLRSDLADGIGPAACIAVHAEAGNSFSPARYAPEADAVSSESPLSAYGGRIESSSDAFASRS